MERDFMGLGTKVKQEVPEETTDSAAIGQSSTMQWTFRNNKCSGQQFLSFNSSKNEKPKTGFEALASAGLVSITTSDSSNSLQKQGGNHYAVTTFPQNPFDSNTIHHVTAPSSLAAMSYPAHNSFISPVGPNLVGSASPQPMPINMRSVPVKNSNSPVVGTTELRNMSKNLDAPAQLTIFYAGSVCVYDDISPEKAQAIMLLAGNKPSVTSNPQVSVPMSPVQMPTIRPNPIVMNSFVENQNRVPMSCFSSLVSVTSVSSSQSAGGGGGGGGSVTCDDAAAVRTIVTLKSPCSKTDLHKNVKSIGFAPLPTILPPGSGVPQFRKASLARFLVKRKERVMSASPYCEENKQDKENNKNHHGSSSKSISVSSSGSCALPAGAI